MEELGSCEGSVRELREAVGSCVRELRGRH